MLGVHRTLAAAVFWILAGPSLRQARTGARRRGDGRPSVNSAFGSASCCFVPSSMVAQVNANKDDSLSHGNYRQVYEQEIAKASQQEKANDVRLLSTNDTCKNEELCKEVDVQEIEKMNMLKLQMTLESGDTAVTKLGNISPMVANLRYINMNTALLSRVRFRSLNQKPMHICPGFKFPHDLLHTYQPLISLVTSSIGMQQQL
ncbi:hypothetical protein EJB05_46203, partial [Eragrostis curvula]